MDIRLAVKLRALLGEVLPKRWRVYQPSKEAMCKADAVVQEFLDTGRLPIFDKIAIEISERCNRRCHFCPNSIYEQGNDLISIALFHKIVLELSDIGYSSMLALHQYNEPLLDKRLPSLISFAREHLPAVTIMLATNGDQLTLNLWKTLRTSGLDYANVGQYDGEVKPHIQRIKDALSNSEQAAFRVVVRGSSQLTNTRGGLVNIDRIPKAPLRECCARPFYRLVIRHSGLAVVCCEDYLCEVVLGDTRKQKVMDIWTGIKANEIRFNLARENRSFAKVCAQCSTSYKDSVTKCLAR